LATAKGKGSNPGFSGTSRFPTLPNQERPKKEKENGCPKPEAKNLGQEWAFLFFGGGFLLEPKAEIIQGVNPKEAPGKSTKLKVSGY